MERYTSAGHRHPVKTYMTNSPTQMASIVSFSFSRDRLMSEERVDKGSSRTTTAYHNQYTYQQ